ncbi:lysine exporter LysO family protein [Brucepastera parasyntrophica]|uniref:lysine exporter LysO family protein n=1 Tax=Brucepastera parasyntrophica TaxID=2880008 RepID=UPI00210E63C2|nr:lysine exporter LysO family protein [Brucepastera parasyntrophica]ULQ59013.1 lysine exporter LysO family protein [Brucepastera parasyntrophica]
MEAIISVLLLILFLAGGFIAAKTGLIKYSPVIERFFSVTLYLLLLSMGLRLGQSREILANLPVVGLLAVSSAVFACAGSVLCHVLMKPVYRRINRASDRNPQQPDKTEPARPALRKKALFFLVLKKPAILLLLVCIGTAVGYFLPEIPILNDGTLNVWILNVLLFLIGIQMASGNENLKTILLRPSILILPLVTVIGTLAGSLGTLVFSGMTLNRALALGSGFGWYSLSGVLISNLGDPLLGAASFLSNLFRETIAFLCIPFLKLTRSPESSIGIAGATSMDVTLPVITDTWGTDVVPQAVIHGLVLSLLVPFLIPLCMAL